MQRFEIVIDFRAQELAAALERHVGQERIGEGPELRHVSRLVLLQFAVRQFAGDEPFRLRGGEHLGKDGTQRRLAILPAEEPDPSRFAAVGLPAQRRPFPLDLRGDEQPETLVVLGAVVGQEFQRVARARQLRPIPVPFVRRCVRPCVRRPREYGWS